ncbi:MAG: caspase family protein [Thermodesulfovibrionales bacterium]
MDNPNKIELSTRRNILDGFIVTRISWYGNLEQANFLGRLFDLSKLPSTDHRYKTADEDIWKHTVANNDWTDEWVFTDRRFNFLHIEDKLFLEFLCQTIHPTVRDNQDQVVTLLEIYNNNLSKNGYELFQSGDIAGRPIYEAREIKAVAMAAAKPHKETKLALVIGCSEYNYAGVLANPLNDANSIEEKLQSLGFDVLKILNPNQKELKKIIDDFGDTLKGYDVGLFYFAGHGVQVKGMNYLIPVDANLKTERMVEYDCVEASRVLGYMEDSKALVNIVILDACRDNPFERSWGRGVSLRGLTTMNAPSGSLIAYSTSPGKTASDGDGVNGLYTHSLIEHIGSKQVTIMTMFQNVRKDVMTKSKNEQIPWESTSLTADYFFNP